MKMKDEDLPHLFTLAKNVSKHSDYRIKMGSVIVKHGKPISVGFNKIKSHPKYSGVWGKTIHAEAQAVISAGTDLVGASIFVYRERGDGRDRKSVV
jgi:deoxycytidylate deaminase